MLAEQLPGKDYVYFYDDAYLASDHPAISVTLPKRKEPYTSSRLFPFFANMLPEGMNRKVICRSLRVDERDLFGLLSAMAGKDFIGGVHLETPS